ncbi:MAG TPA: hypothetical protein VK618_04205 [Flavitalea sp.]|nr:hypothetical protein [Flavitalea sp.]
MNLCNRLSIHFIITTLVTLTSFSATSQIPKYNSYPSAPATVYLDFDGETVMGTSWNWDSTIHAVPSGVIQPGITEVFNRVAEDYRIFNLNITTDPAVYDRAPIAKRVRIILTPTSNWYGIAGGVAFVNSFVWGDGTPAWVFTDQLQFNPKYVAEAASHEIGHTLGLQHQSTYDQNCQLVNEYAEGKGEGEIGWAPIMGVGYYKNQTTWHTGPSIIACNDIQNDIDIVANGMNEIGLRPDEYGNTLPTARPVILNGNNFHMSGIISTATDVDVFKVTYIRTGNLKVQVIPNNVGTGNEGANLDLKISLVKSNGDTIGRYNPKTILSASLDTNLVAGAYYIVIDGVENQNVKNYSSLGYFSMDGAIVLTPLQVNLITLTGAVQKTVHAFNWTLEALDPITGPILESSHDGTNYQAVSTLIPIQHRFSYIPTQKGPLYYRLKVQDPAGDETVYYSNVVTLDTQAPAQVTSLLSTSINGSATITVGSDHAYQLFDETGRLLQKGKLSAGMNTVSLQTTKKGVLLLKVFNAREQSVFKLVNH